MAGSKKEKFYYGWVVAACCMLMVCATALLSVGMSTNLNAMRMHLGFTNTQNSIVLTIRSISAFLATLCANKYYKMGLKKGMVLSLLISASTFVLFALAGSNIYIFYVAAVLGGIGYAYGLMLPASMILKNWFNRSRGVALSIASSGTGLASVIFAPLVQSTVNSRGIRAAFLLQGAFLLFICLVVAVLIVENPDDRGMEPLGGKDWSPDFQHAGEPRHATELPYLWIAVLVGSTVMVGIGASPAASNITNNLVTAGLDVMDAARGLSVYGAVLIGAKILYGVSVDKFGTLRSTLVFGLLTAASMLMMFLINYMPGNLFMYVTLVIMAVAVPVQTLGYPNWVVDLDSAHYNNTLVKCQTGYQLGAVVGSFIAGPIADATGSYALAYLIFFFCNLVPVALVSLCYRVTARKKW